MKRITIVILALLANFAVKAQSYTFTELLDMTSKNFDDQESAVLNKGFSPSAIAGKLMKGYRRGRTSDGHALEIISISYNSHDIIYSTTDSETYESLKAELKSRGFIFSGIEDRENKPRKYIKEKREIYLYDTVTDDVSYYNMQIY